MRYAFLGAVESSAALLAALSDAGADIVAVGTLPNAVGSARHGDFVDIGAQACALGIPVFEAESREGLAAMIAASKPDCLLVFGWSRLVPMDIVEALPLGGIGFHPAPIPQGRGRHPLIWSIILGVQEGAVSFFRLSEDPDAGDIFAQAPFPIADDETARSLMDKVLAHAVDTIPLLLARLEGEGLAAAYPQDHTKAVVWRKRSRADGRIDFRMGVQAIDGLVRALSPPYPGAEAQHADLGTVTIWRIAIVGDKGRHDWVEPGRVVGLEDGMPIVCAQDGLIRLVDIETPGPIREGSWFC